VGSSSLMFTPRGALRSSCMTEREMHGDAH
jgi:hypothetical protein